MGTPAARHSNASSSNGDAPRTRLVTCIFIALLTLGFGSLWYVTAPPRSPESYRERTAQSAAGLRSQILTARRWSTMVERGRATERAATVGIQDAEESAAATTRSIEAWDVPRGTPERYPREIRQLASDATELLATMRQAAHRGEWEHANDTARAVPDLERRLTRLEHEAHP